MSNNPNAIASSSSKLDLLRKKREELGSIARGHKRKLREYLITSQCDLSVHPLPQISTTTTISPEHQKILDDADITKGKRFQESSIPPRRQLRSDTAKLIAANSTNRISPTPSASTPKFSKATAKDHATQAQPRDDKPNGQPFELDDDDAPTLNGSKETGQDSTIDIKRNQNGLSRRSSRGSQTSEALDGNGVDTVMVDQPDEQSDIQVKVPPIIHSKSPNQNGTSTHDESRHASPRIPSKVPTPIPEKDEEDEAVEDRMEHEKDVDVPLLSNDESVKEEPESRKVEIDSGVEKTANSRVKAVDAPSSISLQIPKHAADVVSSPESTSGALSATTPALHEASTDTSPDNEALHYDPNLSQRKMSDAQSPTDPTRHDEESEVQSIAVPKEEIAETPVDDRPTSADAQLQLDAEQAAAAASSARTPIAHSPEPVKSTDVAEETRQDAIDEDEVMGGVPRPQDEADLKETRTPILDQTKEIPDSQESQGTSQMADNGLVAHQDLALINTSRESRKSPEKQFKAPKEPSPTTVTPRRTPSIAPPTERMITRVSSGAIRNRSVSEIIGEKEYQTTSPTEASARKASESHSSKSTSRASTPQTPLMRSIVEKAKEKERSKLSTVIFAKQPNKRLSDEFAALPSGSKQQSPKSDDYLRPYFEAQASEKLNFQPLQSLLQSAHKTISTADANLPIQQTQMLKILRRVQHLQQDNKWSLRQPKRSAEPNRPTTHQDLLIQEMKWMRTDFREERKWKNAVAKNLARDCAVYHEAKNHPAEQALLKVKLRRSTRPWKAKELTVRKDCYPTMEIEIPESDVEMMDVNDHPTPDLIPSGDDSSPPEDFDDDVVDLRDTVAPTAIFTLADDDVVFRLTTSPTSEKLLNELPLYGVPLRAPQSILPTSEISPDAHWKRPILPLSKYTEGQMVIIDAGPPRKKSRYEYETEDDDDVVVFGERHTQPKLPPENSDVALFNPENKHIRDRIHAGHQFRPPSEFPMPMQSFFENREPSQWTKEEEDELKNKVREYSYNWSLISSELQRGSAQSCTLYNTVAERRTPWECFEKWVSMEGLPQDMAKTTYFRAYTTRLATAERNLALQSGSMPTQPPNGGGPSQLPKRQKRSAVAVRVPARRNQKHLHIVDAMRKNAKKKENALAKQLQAAATVQQRKANDQAQQAQANAAPRAANQTLYTPQDLSRVKHEREVAFKERLERYQQQQLAQRQAQLVQARNAQQAQQNPQMTAQQQQALQQQQRNGTAATGGGNVPNPMPNSQNLAVPGQTRNPMQQPGASLPMQLSNPTGLAPPMSMNGIPQAQMQNMQNMQGLRGAVMPQNTPSPAQMMAARQISEQQRLMAQQQHAQGSSGSNGQGANPNPNVNGQNSPPNMRGSMAMGMNMNMNQVGANPAMRQNFMGNGGGISTTSANIGLPPPGLQQGSPRMGRPQVPPTVFHAMRIEIQTKHPTASPEQVQQMMNNLIAARTQNAMHAAAGAGGGGSPVSAFNASSPISGSMPNPISNAGVNVNGTSDNDASINGISNAAMMRGSLGNASGLQPQMYASMLRQQQQQQQMQQMHAQQQAAQGGGGGHGRNGSLSAQQNQAGGQNGQGQNQQGNSNAQQGNGVTALKG